jgi:hypothetical protein
MRVYWRFRNPSVRVGFHRQRNHIQGRNGGTISASKLKRVFSCLTSDKHGARYELGRDKKAPRHRRGLLFGGLEGLVLIRIILSMLQGTIRFQQPVNELLLDRLRNKGGI